MGKYAICLIAGVDNVGSAVNGFEYARSLVDADHDVAVFLDGEATRWPGEVAARPDHPVATALTDLQDRLAINGACAYCADVYETAEECRQAGISLLGTPGETHRPDVGKLAAEGYELVTIG